MSVFSSRLNIRIFAVVFLSNLGLISFIFYHNYQEEKYLIRQQIQSHLSSVVQTTALGVSAEEHQQIVKKYLNKNSIQNNSQEPLYTKIHQYLLEVQKASGLNTPIYTMKKKDDDTLFFVVTSAQTPYYRHSYIPPKVTLEKYFIGGTLDEYSDKHGSWISAFAPIVDRNGQTVAILQADRKLDEFYQEIYERSMFRFEVTVVLFSAIIVLSFLYLNHLLSYHLLSPIQSVIREILVVSDKTMQVSQELGEINKLLTNNSQQSSSSLDSIHHALEPFVKTILDNIDRLTASAALARESRDNIHSTNSHVHDMTHALQDIYRSSQTISYTTKTIDKLNTDIRIIAVNAAIEAAKAGKYGDSLAVIADEIRLLSQKTTTFSRKIDEEIEHSLDNSKKGKTVQEKVNKNVSLAVTKVVEAEQNIAEISSTFRSRQQEIKNIYAIIQSIHDVLLDNSQKTSQSKKIVQDFYRQIDLLQVSISKLRKVVG